VLLVALSQERTVFRALDQLRASGVVDVAGSIVDLRPQVVNSSLPRAV